MALGNGTADRATATIECRTIAGMFPHELGILIRGADRWYESMVDADLVVDVNDAGDGGLLPVEIVSRESERVLVQLPQQVVAGGRRIWVNQSDLNE